MAIPVSDGAGERFNANRALIDAAESMTPDEIHQHPMAALDKMRALARELRVAQSVPSDARVLREAIQSALSKLRHFPNNGADSVLRAALASVSDPQRKVGE